MPADRPPDRCPTCGSDDPRYCFHFQEGKHEHDASVGCCPDAFHDQPPEPRAGDDAESVPSPGTSRVVPSGAANRDIRSPAQVAEECEREAQEKVSEALCCAVEAGAKNDDQSAEESVAADKAAYLSITRYGAAARWATADLMIYLAAFDTQSIEEIKAVLTNERDRLRRAFEEASK